MKLGIVGAGRAAWAFGSAWRAIGRPLSGLHARSPVETSTLLGTHPLPLDRLLRESDIILLAVSDAAIPVLAAEIARGIRDHALAFHPSGSLSAELFAPHRRAFSLHPLRSLPHVGERCDFRETLFTYEGPPECRELARDFVEAVGGHFSIIEKEQKARYHAAAVFASNYVAALLEIARELMRHSGIGEEVGPQLAALAHSAVDNWQRGEFTGPVARGDQELIARHLEALRQRPDEAELYRGLAAALAKALQRNKF